MNPNILLILGILTDLVLLIFLSTMIDQIGILFFSLLAVLLLGGTFFAYMLVKKNYRQR